jgi:hypothetical protein
MLRKRAASDDEGSAVKGHAPPLPKGEVERPRSGRQGEGVRRLRLRLESWKRIARRSRSRDVKRAANLHQHPLEPLANLVIGEADLQQAIGLDRATALRVGNRLSGMLRSIDLDGEARLPATVIDDEAGDRNLAPKLPSVEAAVSQLLPKRLFRSGRVCAKAAGEMGPLKGHRRQDSSQFLRSERACAPTSPTERGRDGGSRRGEGFSSIRRGRYPSPGSRLRRDSTSPFGRGGPR